MTMDVNAYSGAMVAKKSLKQTAVRIPENMLRDLDALARNLTRDRPTDPVTRADAIRLLLHEGILRYQALENRRKAAMKPPNESH